MPNGRGIAVKALRSLPKQKLVTVIMSNGASISMPMAVRKFMDKYRMTVDPTNHPLWSGKAVQVRAPGAHQPNPTAACARRKWGAQAWPVRGLEAYTPPHGCMHELADPTQRAPQTTVVASRRKVDPDGGAPSVLPHGCRVLHGSTGVRGASGGVSMPLRRAPPHPNVSCEVFMRGAAGCPAHQGL